jgi:hypothetical protein
MIRTLSICCLIWAKCGTSLPAQQQTSGKSAADATLRSPYVQRMMSLDRNSDELLAKNELPGALSTLIDTHDADGDGMLNQSELSAIEDEAAAARQSPQNSRQRRGKSRQGNSPGPRGRRQSITRDDGSPVDSKQILRFALTFDKDRDGGLNAAELRLYATALAKRREQGRRQDDARSAKDSPEKSGPPPKGLGADGVGNGGFGDGTD